ncbi:hypothetical protein [Gryllotalpicola ginsengisoli]|uniref:hypothetical protein n=1 Tax=Gryllotalpicola ginsengisoli TaxID=444608 RepID=UPI00040A38C4|nr:hypothetical protein [Gryllotalpicola ginsengisoli]
MNTVRERITHASDWLDDKLIPVLGPAPLGPFEPGPDVDPAPGEFDALCPVCHGAMARHEHHVDASTGHVYLRCPDTGVELETARHE